MKLLEDRILKDGQVFPGDILKIDNFLNHQIDIKLIQELGKEFHNLFLDSSPDKILTIEASGISIACATAHYFDDIPVVFAKKTNSLNISPNVFTCKEKSYTRGHYYDVQVSKNYLKENERILIIDDFLANGEAMNSLINICNQAKAIVVGCGAVVSKTYQPGEKRIKEMGYHLEALARVKSMDEEGHIEFDSSKIE